jgi:hypothetical protein
MFDNWPESCLAIGKQLLALLCRGGAYAYRNPGRGDEVWVAWDHPSGQKHNWIAQLMPLRRTGAVKLKIRIGRDSEFIGAAGPLVPSSEAKYKDSECDSGLVNVGGELPPELAIWIGKAFEFCTAKYGIGTSETHHNGDSVSTTPPSSVDGAISSHWQASDIDTAPPNRVQTTVSRIVRDTALSSLVKQLHNYECQICGHTIVLPDGSRYAEAHHVQPLGSPHDGPDVIQNILCLCPNDHAVCDLGAIRLSLDKLRTVKGHSVTQRYIDYHNQHIHGEDSVCPQIAY